MTKINLNDNVKFKLTKDGKEFLKELNTNHSLYKLCPISFKKTKDGYYNAQLWELFHYFGTELYMGSNLPMETEILIDN